MRSEDIARLDEMTFPELELVLDDHTQEEKRVDRYTAFSWSASRHAMLDRCPRQYYLNYYGARRVRDAAHRAISAIWWLKQATTLRTWIGTVIHNAARFAIQSYRDGTPISREVLLDHTTRDYRNGVRASERGTKHDGRWLVLHEHIYPDDSYSIDRAEAERLVVDLTNTLFDSEAYQQILNAPPPHIKEIDEPFQSFTLQGFEEMPRGVRIFAIPDVLIHDGEQITIIDWKTGSVEHDSLRHQAGVYRLYAHHAYGLPGEAITVKLAELAEYGELVDPSGGVPSVDEANTFLRKSIAHMFALMRSIEYNTVALKDFPRTSDLSLCEMCGFKRACWRHGLSHEYGQTHE